MANRSAKITKRTVDASHPEGGTYVVWDDDLKGFGQAAWIERRVVTAVGAGGRRAQALTHEHFG